MPSDLRSVSFTNFALKVYEFRILLNIKPIALFPQHQRIYKRCKTFPLDYFSFCLSYTAFHISNIYKAVLPLSLAADLETVSQDSLSLQIPLQLATIFLDINFCTNAKWGQKVLFRERAKSAYFRSAS